MNAAAGAEEGCPVSAELEALLEDSMRHTTALKKFFIFPVLFAILKKPPHGSTEVITPAATLSVRNADASGADFHLVFAAV